ncbi:DUF3016 domain-containing protein [Agaribacter flavus]|uniref:DUF3016 domain-containing protein n=1 Tax=Agaribacter flavus TaxID=1902781 RepID=A0ABV7FSC7_9ALTE
MKHLLPKTLLIAGSLCFLSPAIAEEENFKTEIENGRVNIEWVKPTEFRDVHPSGNTSTRIKYRKFVFNRLHKHVEKLAEKFPEGYELSLTVNDLDMAGDTRRNFNFVRIMQRIDIPRIKFSYELKDDKGQIVSSDTVNLRDMNYLDNASRIGSQRALYFEREMLSDWFKKEFKEVINA